MNWQKAVNKINLNRYKIPEGWDTKEKIAQELQCAPERVHEILKGGIASGEFESEEFPVWDPKRRMAVRVRCYRQKQEDDEGRDRQKQDGEGSSLLEQKILEQKIVRSLKRNPGHSDSQIAKNIRGSTVGLVERTRSKYRNNLKG